MEPTFKLEDYYFNEDGLIVLTEAFHIKRGYCCGNGCLHCPFGYNNVPEPKRTILLEEKKRKKEDKNDNQITTGDDEK